MNTKPKTLTPMAIVRLVLYVVSALLGLAAVVVNHLGYSDLADLLIPAAGAAASITGGTAVYNLPKAPDQNRLDLAAALPAVLDIAAAARAYTSAMNHEPAHAATGSLDPATDEYVRMIRGGGGV